MHCIPYFLTSYPVGPRLKMLPLLPCCGSPQVNASAIFTGKIEIRKSAKLHRRPTTIVLRPLGIFQKNIWQPCTYTSPRIRRFVFLSCLGRHAYPTSIHIKYSAIIASSFHTNMKALAYLSPVKYKHLIHLSPPPLSFKPATQTALILPL